MNYDLDLEPLQFDGEFEGVSYLLDYDGAIQFMGATKGEQELTEQEFLQHLEEHEMPIEALLPTIF